MSQITQLSGASFEEEVLQSQQPVLVDYWAPWCGPCRALGPIVDQTAESYAGRLKVAKLNVDENRTIAAKYGIRAIPTLMLFRNGEPVAQHTGALTRAELDDFLQSNQLH